MKLKYICQYCSKELTRHNNLLKHEKLCKLNPNNSYNTIYKCEYCNKIYTHKYVFNRHLKTHSEYNYQKPEYIWQCSICNKEFKSRRILGKHKKEHYQNENNNSKYVTYHPIINAKCKFCNKVCKTKSSLIKHENYCNLNPNHKIYFGHKQSEETKEKISKSLKLAIKEGRAYGWESVKQNKNGMSYPEIWLENVINNEFIDKNYEYNMQFFKYKLDFAWPHKKKCIEIDGAQHNLPERKLSDKNKDELLKKNGWDVLRLKWGYIVKNTKEALNLIIDFLNGTGDITIPAYKSQTEIREEKRKENELNGVLKNKIGRFCPRKLTNDQWLKRKEIILNSNVDLTKLGWKSEVERKTDLTRREICGTVEHFLDLQELCYKRK